MGEVAKLSNAEFNEDIVSPTHYVGVMFESRYGSTEENPKFYGKEYNYRTDMNYKKGQVIEIDSQYGKTKVCIINEDVPADVVEARMKSIGLSLNDVREI